MVIPWSALSNAPPAEGGELRANFFLSVGETKKNLAWRTPHKRTFHAPEAFGILRLEKSATHRSLTTSRLGDWLNFRAATA